MIVNFIWENKNFSHGFFFSPTLLNWAKILSTCVIDLEITQKYDTKCRLCWRQQKSNVHFFGTFDICITEYLNNVLKINFVYDFDLSFHQNSLYENTEFKNILKYIWSKFKSFKESLCTSKTSIVTFSNNVILL